MNRIFQFITKANQVLLFVGLLAVLGIVAYNIYPRQSSHYAPPHVTVVEPEKSSKPTPIKDVRFLAQRAAVNVFAIVKSEVLPANTQTGRRVGELHMARVAESGSESGSEEERDEIVNVVFMRGSEKIRTLLSADGIVFDHGMNWRDSDNRVKPLACFLFDCVTEDTDHNKVLDARDRRDLYLVSPDLSKPDLIIPDLRDYDIISDQVILVKTGSGGNPRFFQVNTTTLEKTELVWK